MSGVNLDSKKILELLEKHVDKVVLVIIALLCLLLLWKFVIGSPYSVKQNRIKYTPANIDKLVSKRAGRIEGKLDGGGEPKSYRNNNSAIFNDMMVASVRIDSGNTLYIQPGEGKVLGGEKRTYSKPDIPAATEISATSFRTVVHVPTETVDMAMPYASAQTELKDIDMISVQLSFDVQTLYANFERSFSGRWVRKMEWRDDMLARPVFAAVQLERQDRLADGNWSQWQIIPRARIDQRREMFNLPEKISQVTLGGIELLMMNYDKFEAQKGLLQPDAYDFAASNVEWLPPAFHSEVLDIRAKEAKLLEREERGFGRSASRTRGMDTFDEGEYDDGDSGSKQKLTARQRKLLAAKEKARRKLNTRRNVNISTRDRTVDHVYEDYAYALITEAVDFKKLLQPLLIWAHDDTVQENNTYRYRVKVGVFNPTAGKNWFASNDASFRDDVVLWGEYSPVTEPISIGPMLYLFPTAIERTSGNVTMDIAKFHRGNWRTHEFSVGIGQTIGEPVEIVEDEYGRPSRRLRPLEVGEGSEIIDFSSGAILIDIDMAPNLSAAGIARVRPYRQVFLTKNGKDISRLPVTKGKWPRKLQILYGEVKDAEIEPVVVSLTRTTGTNRRTVRTTGRSAYSGYDEDEEEGEYIDYSRGAR